MTRTKGSPLRFFALAYALTWAAWLPMLFRPDDLQPLHFLGSLGPLVAAFVLTAAAKIGHGSPTELTDRLSARPPQLAGPGSAGRGRDLSTIGG